MKVNMVDVSKKKEVLRTAVAAGTLYLKKETISLINAGKIKKGDVFTVSEIAAINAVKDTYRMIPLCHNIPIAGVDVGFTVGEDHISSRVTVTSSGKTGVEMEALAGVSVCLLNLWDMVKYLEKDDSGKYPGTRITGIMVIDKKKEEI